MGDLQLRKPGQSILSGLDFAPQPRQGLLSAAAATGLGSGASDTASVHSTAAWQVWIFHHRYAAPCWTSSTSCRSASRQAETGVIWCRTLSSWVSSAHMGSRVPHTSVLVAARSAWLAGPSHLYKAFAACQWQQGPSQQHPPLPACSATILQTPCLSNLMQPVRAAAWCSPPD